MYRKVLIANRGEIALRVIRTLRRIASCCIAMAVLCSGAAAALDCGADNGYMCQGTQNQYAGGFSPGVGYGGFGGGSCTATKTPVVFLHGNGGEIADRTDRFAFYQSHGYGVAFLSWLNGRQPGFSMVAGLQAGRSVPHLVRAFQLADRAGLLLDPELAAHRLGLLLAVHGFEV